MRQLGQHFSSLGRRARYLLVGAVMAFGALLMSAPAQANGSALHGGVGFRLLDGEALSTAHLRYEMDAMLGIRVHVGIDGYMGAPGKSDGLLFGGGQAGLTTSLFGFGPLVLEGGVALAWNRFLPEIHGFEDSYVALHGEVGLRARFGLVEARAAWTMPVMPITQAVDRHAFAHQFTITAGIRF